MTRTASSDPTTIDRLRHRRHRNAIEAVLAKATLIAVAILFCVEVVSTAQPDAPVYQATFDVAPPVDTPPPQTGTDQSWRAAHVAHGMASDTLH